MRTLLMLSVFGLLNAALPGLAHGGDDLELDASGLAVVGTDAIEASLEVDDLCAGVSEARLRIGDDVDVQFLANVVLDPSPCGSDDPVAFQVSITAADVGLDLDGVGAVAPEGDVLFLEPEGLAAALQGTFGGNNIVLQQADLDLD